MNTQTRMLLTTLFIAVAGMTPAGAQTAADVNQRLDDLFGEHAPYQEFFDQLKTAVAEDDKETIASMVDYPFTARIDEKAVTIKDAEHFVTDYDKIVTDAVKEAISDQTYPTLSATWQGVMIGDGEVWFGGICSDETCEKQTVRIIAIND